MLNIHSEFCFSISYVELAATLDLSIKDFEFVSENELEEGIIRYKNKSKANSQLLFFEPELDSNVKRDIYYDIRPQSDTSYLVFVELVKEVSLLAVEKNCISIAESIGTNGFFLLKNKAPFVAFLKKDKNWYWLPLQPRSLLPVMQSKLFPFSEINEGEEFFTTFLKT